MVVLGRSDRPSDWTRECQQPVKGWVTVRGGGGWAQQAAPLRGSFGGREAVRREPGFGDGWNALGLLLAAAGRDGEATAAFQTAHA